MNNSSLPPPHPSLPRPPQAGPSSSSTLYSHQPQAYYNSHYVQAYSQPQTQVSFSTPPSNFTRNPSVPQLSWYQPGNNRCSHPGCTFTGSHKTVEIHMMDRHLIFPPGWDKRPKKSEWDADPSLKGKSIPIQGTNVILDSPEVLEAWIAERKRRFPTSAKVEEKKRKMQEAIARGQLDIGDSGRPNKRRNVDHGNNSNHNHKNNKNQNRNRTNRGEGARLTTEQRIPDSGWPRKTQTKDLAPNPEPILVRLPSASSSGSESDEDDEDDQPEAMSSKVISCTEPVLSIDHGDTGVPAKEMSPPKVVSVDKTTRKKVPLQPKLPPKNPFASRPTLLRNLLLPEIRVTISNLSQAIRFLVDNDFLRDVELKPGQAEGEKNKIQVVSNESNIDSTH